MKNCRAATGYSWCVAALLLNLFGAHATAQIASSGDVYYKVHVDQQFRYYVFANSVVVWENQNVEGTSLATSAAHDTTFPYGSLGLSAALSANAGSFTADLNANIGLDARTGIFHQLTNSIRVDVYIKGGTGTPYWITVAGTGQVDASRTGGARGTLQPLNGISSASFMDSTATMDSTGAESIPVAETYSVSGVTTTTLLVSGDTYSYAGAYTFGTPASVSQAICVLGCMTSAATFNAVSTGHVQIDVFPYVSPVSAPPLATPAGDLLVRASPNPSRGGTTVSWSAPAGQQTRVEVFDMHGRLVKCLEEGPATGQPQHVAWQASGLREGLYFVRVHSGERSSTTKVILSR